MVRLNVAAWRRCGRTRIVTPKPQEKELAAEPDALVIALARAFRWQEQIESGSVPSVSALADQEGVDEAFVRRQLRMTLHPPRIIEDLANGGNSKGSISEAVRQDPNETWDLEGNPGRG